MDVVKYLGVAWLICSCQAVLASQAANCVHDNGQTFINLPGQNNDSPQLKYGIYKQATPFTEQGGQLDISSAQFVAHTDFTKSNSPSTRPLTKTCLTGQRVSTASYSNKSLPYTWPPLLAQVVRNLC